MLESLRHVQVSGDDLVTADRMLAALTAAPLVFEDGAVQVFTSDGGTTYTERGRPSKGEWWVIGDGKFGSFWPPDYRAAYTLRWVVRDGTIIGLSFSETNGSTCFQGRYL